MQRLRALASWMTTGVVTLAIALAVVTSGQLEKVPTPVASPTVTTVAVSHRPHAVTHDVVRAIRSRLVATSVHHHTSKHDAPVHRVDIATTTVPATTTSTSTTSTTTTSTTSTTSTTLPLATTTTRPHHGDDGGGSGGGGSDDPPGSD